MEFTNDDIVNDDSFSKLIKSQENKLALNNKDYDPRVKEVGDRIIIWDCSSVTFEEERELLDYDYDNIINKELIVIKNNEKKVFQSMYVNYLQDLVVVNTETKVMYRVASRHVKIV
jgi:hypothetical protein